jgi:hypothetical protein
MYRNCVESLKCSESCSNEVCNVQYVRGTVQNLQNVSEKQFAVTCSGSPSRVQCVSLTVVRGVACVQRVSLTVVSGVVCVQRVTDSFERSGLRSACVTDSFKWSGLRSACH